MGITLDSLNSALHSVEIANAAGQALSIDGSGYLTANINGTVAVSASDLDIRNLLFASDSVDVSGSSVSISGSVAVTATDLDIRDLSSASDSVAAVQSGSWSVDAVQSGVWNIGTLTGITNDVNIADGGNSITVDASALDLSLIHI